MCVVWGLTSRAPQGSDLLCSRPSQGPGLKGVTVRPCCWPRAQWARRPTKPSCPLLAPPASVPAQPLCLVPTELPAPLSLERRLISQASGSSRSSQGLCPGGVTMHFTRQTSLWQRGPFGSHGNAHGLCLGGALCPHSGCRVPESQLSFPDLSLPWRHLTLTILFAAASS